MQVDSSGRLRWLGADSLYRPREGRWQSPGVPSSLHAAVACDIAFGLVARRLLGCAVGLIIGTMLCVHAQADDEASGLRQQIDASIEWFELSSTGPDGGTLEARKVLRWDNVSRGSQEGLTLLYVRRGRAVAVCCIYPWQNRLVHEFGSLARGGIRGSQEGTLFWNVSTPGLEFKPIPFAPPPAETDLARRSQMKRLAQRFEGTLLGWKRDDSDRQVLRLLARPLYEYEEPKDVLDGAVFSLSMGVDPEILLLIEAVEHKQGHRWEYGLVRKTSGELEVKLDDDVVWHADRFPRTNDPSAIHRNVQRPLSLVGAQP